MAKSETVDAQEESMATVVARDLRASIVEGRLAPNERI